EKAEHKAEMEAQKAKAKKTSTRSRRKEKSMFEQIMSNTTTRQIGRTVAREFTRGLLGVLGIKTRR
ncbi:MAG: helicase HerA-like domain-containing protein, partial [Lewinella sp.]